MTKRLGSSRNDDWRKQAACKSMGPSLFFGGGNETYSQRIAREATAKAVCERCPVAVECLKDSEDEEGIWGGKTEAERRQTVSHRTAIVVPKMFVPMDLGQSDNDEPWVALESNGEIMLFRRSSAQSWHGSEFIVIRDGVPVMVTEDLAAAYLAYNSLLS